jgi:hypothetical protein
MRTYALNDCVVKYHMGKLRKDVVLNGVKKSIIVYNEDGTPKYKGNCNIIVPGFGELKFGLGNTKLPETTAYWSTLPGYEGTCGYVSRFVKKCEKDCYANRAMKMRPSLRRAYENNTNISKHLEFGDHLFVAVRSVVEACRRDRGIEKFRIHESGDFFNRRYIDQWVNVAEWLRSEGIIPYCYTSAISLYRYLVDSTIEVTLSDDWGIWGKHYTPTTKIFARKDRLPEGHNAFECPLDCRICDWCAQPNTTGEVQYATVTKH